MTEDQEHDQAPVAAGPAGALPVVAAAPGDAPATDAGEAKPASAPEGEAVGAQAEGAKEEGKEEGAKDKRRERSRSRSRSKEKRRDKSRSRERERSRSRSRRDRSSGHRERSRERRSGRRDRSDSRHRRRDRSRDARRSSRRSSRSRSGGRRRRTRWSPSRSPPRRRHSRSRSRSRGRGTPPSGPVRPTFPLVPGVPGALLPGTGLTSLLPGVGLNPYLMPNLAGGTQAAGLSQATRKQRELYVGNLPNPCYDYQLQTFLNQALVALGLCKTTGKMPIIKCEISGGGGFAFIEFSDVMDCTTALALDGIPYMGNALRMARPKEYVTPFGAPPDPMPLGANALAALLAQEQQGNATAGAAVAAATSVPQGPALPTGVPGAALPGMPAFAAVQAGPNPATRKQRELYIGNLPIPCADFQLQTFLNQTLVALGLCKNTGSMPVVKTQIAPSGAFSFVELADITDATCALALDGIPFMGVPLKIKRPKEYVAPFGAPPDPAPLGAAALAVLAQQNNNAMAGAAMAAATGQPQGAPLGGPSPMSGMPQQGQSMQPPSAGPSSGGGGASWP